MPDNAELDRLYAEAKSALKKREYDRAAGLLTQILVIDENYKDVSRLLAYTVKLKRRRWYNDPRLWGALGFVLLIGLGIWLSKALPRRTATTTLPVESTVTPSMTAIPSMATMTLTPTTTPIPLTWKRISMGQEFQRDTVTAFVIDPKDRDVLYAGMENAGIFKSIDGGLSWRPAHRGLANAHVTSLLIDFQDPQILYAGMLDGIYKTEDGGENWYKIAEETFLLMDPQDSSHLYKRDSTTIYESTDQGKSWEATYSANSGCPGEILGWDIHPTDGDTLFVGGGEACEPGVYISNDGGRDWTLLAKMEIRPGGYTFHDLGLDTLTIGIDKQGEYYIYTQGSSARGITAGVIHNENGTWNTTLAFERPLPETIAFDYTGLVYFHCPPDNFCKSNLDERQKRTLGKPDVGVATSIVISPFDPNTIYVAGKGISVSKDGGQTWTKLNNGLGSTMLKLEMGLDDAGTLYSLSGDCQELRIPQTGSKNYKLEISQLLYISTNDGNTWDFSTQMGCYLIKDADGVTLYRISVVTEWNGAFPTNWIWQSQDGGKSWERIVVPSSPTTLTADSVQSGLLYLYLDYDRGEGVNYHQYISVDYGNKWRASNPEVDAKICYGSTLQFIDAYRPMAIDPFDGNHVFVIDNGTLLESHDSCDTTSVFTTPPSTNINTIAFDPNNPETLYAGTDGDAYISFDGGQIWNQVNDGLLGATVVYSIAVDKDSNVYAATPYGVFKLEGK